MNKSRELTTSSRRTTDNEQLTIENSLITNNSYSLPRILSIDYGSKRTGLAVTDPMKIIASGLAGIHTKELEKFLTDYFKKEEVEMVIIGHPTN